MNKNTIKLSTLLSMATNFYQLHGDVDVLFAVTDKVTGKVSEHIINNNFVLGIDSTNNEKYCFLHDKENN